MLYVLVIFNVSKEANKLVGKGKSIDDANRSFELQISFIRKKAILHKDTSIEVSKVFSHNCGKRLFAEILRLIRLRGLLSSISLLLHVELVMM